MFGFWKIILEKFRVLIFWKQKIIKIVHAQIKFEDD